MHEDARRHPTNFVVAPAESLTHPIRHDAVHPVNLPPPPPPPPPPPTPRYVYKPPPENCLLKPLPPDHHIGTCIYVPALAEKLLLQSVLGHGGYGFVYRAQSPDTHRAYAVKILNKLTAAGQPLAASAARLLENEVNLHARAASHRNVLTVYGAIDSPHCVYLVMEYCHEGDLFAAIIKRQIYKDNAQLALTVFLQLVDAIQFCHSSGVFHRDIKPENIMVSQDGAVVKITDFGLSTEDIVSNQPGVGSRHYTSPECLDPGPAQFYSSAATDVWSLGIVLINLMCGRNPWERASINDCRYATYLTTPGFLSQMLPISPEINTVLEFIFQPDPALRIGIADLKRMAVDLIAGPPMPYYIPSISYAAFHPLISHATPRTVDATIIYNYNTAPFESAAATCNQNPQNMALGFDSSGTFDNSVYHIDHSAARVPVLGAVLPATEIEMKTPPEPKPKPEPEPEPEPEPDAMAGASFITHHRVSTPEFSPPPRWHTQTPSFPFDQAAAEFLRSLASGMDSRHEEFSPLCGPTAAGKEPVSSLSLDTGSCVVGGAWPSPVVVGADAPLVSMRSRSSSANSCSGRSSSSLSVDSCSSRSSRAESSSTSESCAVRPPSGQLQLQLRNQHQKQAFWERDLDTCVSYPTQSVMARVARTKDLISGCI